MVKSIEPQLVGEGRGKCIGQCNRKISGLHWSVKNIEYIFTIGMYMYCKMNGIFILMDVGTQRVEEGRGKCKGLYNRKICELHWSRRKRTK